MMTMESVGKFIECSFNYAVCCVVIFIFTITGNYFVIAQTFNKNQTKFTIVSLVILHLGVSNLDQKMFLQFKGISS